MKKTLIRYSEDVISGKVIACKKHTWACQRFLRDIERAGTDDFPYVFDDKAAGSFFKWMRFFKHRKGPLAGQIKEPHPIEYFVFGNIYGWYHRDTGYRRFNKMYWQVGRKNAKTQDLAIMGLYEQFVFLPEEVAEIYCAATKRDQAELVYDEAVAMLEGCDYIYEGVHYKVAYKKITRLKNGATMRALSKEDRKSGDGTNPQCFIIDEYHAHPTTEIYEIGDSGIGARAQPIVPIITTAGLELNNPCYRIEYKLCGRILDPDDPTELDSYFVMINELDRNETPETIEVGGKKVASGDLIDDIYDEKSWVKANPIACSHEVGIESIRRAVKEAKFSPEKMKGVLTKRLNVWVNARENGYMNMEKYKNRVKSEEYVLEMIRERTDLGAYVGVDLSARIDLTSLAFEIKGEEEEYYVLSRSYMPEDTYLERMAVDHVPYDMWVDAGHLILTPGSAVDYRMIKNDIVRLAEYWGLNIREICVDPHGAMQISGDLIDEGYTVVDIRQGMKSLSEPTKSLREATYNNQATYADYPIFSWAMGNCITRMAHNESIMLDKAKSTQRIDPVAALINAHSRCMLSKPPRKKNPVMFI